MQLRGGGCLPCLSPALIHGTHPLSGCACVGSVSLLWWKFTGKSGMVSWSKLNLIYIKRILSILEIWPLENSLDPRERLPKCPHRPAWEETGADHQTWRVLNTTAWEQWVWEQAAAFRLLFNSASSLSAEFYGEHHQRLGQKYEFLMWLDISDTMFDRGRHGDLRKRNDLSWCVPTEGGDSLSPGW